MRCFNAKCNIDGTNKYIYIYYTPCTCIYKYIYHQTYHILHTYIISLSYCIHTHILKQIQRIPVSKHHPTKTPSTAEKKPLGSQTSSMKETLFAREASSWIAKKAGVVLGSNHSREYARTLGSPWRSMFFLCLKKNILDFQVVGFFCTSFYWTTNKMWFKINPAALIFFEYLCHGGLLLKDGKK